MSDQEKKKSILERIKRKVLNAKYQRGLARRKAEEKENCRAGCHEYEVQTTGYGSDKEAVLADFTMRIIQCKHCGRSYLIRLDLQPYLLS